MSIHINILQYSHVMALRESCYEALAGMVPAVAELDSIRGTANALGSDYGVRVKTIADELAALVRRLDRLHLELE